MFKYRCAACGVSAYSSASYATVGVCPSCGSSLDDSATTRVPEPEPPSRKPLNGPLRPTEPEAPVRGG
jgi:hypothetical protein